ncbi:hypothetical protein WEI85_24205 [Actinomycetes bacterium KLBMP 9797]
MLNVRDAALRRWRKTSPDRVTRQDDYVCGHFLGYASGRANGYVYGDIVDGEIDLTHPGSRERHLQDWVAMVRNAVLPWFVEASDPDLIITSRAADKTSSPAAIIEWLASRSRPELIPAFLNHYLQQHPGWRDDAAKGSTLAAKGQPLGPTTNWAIELGWAGAHHTAG